ncbi:hypothetical protein [Marmoricola sp. RAF53]|uniref:hypothetical protein n=1 Tax=Marmoricola sp. RAF53 TaxID=3233059 RepID=UPI003F985CFC
MTSKRQDTEGIVKGGKLEPVAEGDQLPPAGPETDEEYATAEGADGAETPRRPIP